MAQKTFYYVQQFIREKGKMRPGNVFEASNERTATLRAEKLEGSKTVGAIAYSKTGDPVDGIWDDDPVILGVYGEVPEEVSI